MFKRVVALGLLLVLAVTAPAFADVPPTANFAEATVSTGYSSVATSVVLSTGQGAKFPSTYPYPVVWWDCTTYTRPGLDPNVEIVLVTNRSTDTLTVTRGQDGTSAANHNTAGKQYCIYRSWVKYDVDQTRSSISSSSGGTEVYDAGNYASFVAAVTALCADSNPHTLRVSAVQSVASNKTVCDNVQLQFIGSGRLDVATGVTVTLAKPSQIFAPQRRTIFSWTGTGAVAFTDPGEVWPEWWGWNASTSAANGTTYFKKMIDSLPANSAKAGVISFDAVTYVYDDEAPTNSRNVWLKGHGKLASHVYMTGIGNAKHGIYCSGTTKFLRVTDLDWSPYVAHTADNFQTGIRCDQSNDAPSMPSGTIVEAWDVMLNGWNIGFYADGGPSGNVTRAAIYRSEITVGGSGADAVNEGVNVLRTGLAVGEDLVVAGSSKADHCLYALSVTNITFRRNVCKNILNESIKMVTIGSPETAPNPRFWLAENNINTTVGTCFLVTAAQADVLDIVSLIGNVCDGITGSLGSNDTGIYIQAHGTAKIKMVRMDALTCANAVNECVNIEAITGSYIDHVSIRAVNFYNWSTSSSGTYSGISASSAGTKGMLEYSGVFDGNSNGRQILGPDTRSYFATVDAGPVSFKNLTNADENILTAQIGTGTSRTRVGGAIDRSVTSQATTGTSEQTIGSLSIPSGTFCSNGKSVRFAASGVAAANANTKTVRLKINGTTIISNDVTTAPNNVVWRIEGETFRIGSNSQRTSANMYVGGALQTTKSIDTTCTDTASCAIIVTGQTPTASGDITFYNMKLDYDN